MPNRVRDIDYDLNVELGGCLAYIDSRLHLIERQIDNAGTEVERDLEKMIESNLKEISDEDIRRKILDFKEKNKEILLRSKLESLFRAKDKLVSYKNRFKDISSSPLIRGAV